MRASKILMTALNLLTITAVFICNYFYQSTGFPLRLKMTCSILFASLGLVNFVYALLTKQKPLLFYLGMSISLILACLGDYFIAKDFVLGAVVFALGHIGFILSYHAFGKIKLLDVLVSAGIFLSCLAFLLACLPLAVPEPIVCVVGVVYALIISTMLGKAIANAIRVKSATAILIAVASSLFLISDILLAAGWFFPRSGWIHNACMGTYYPALCLLAFSLLIKAFSTKNSQKSTL